MNFKTTTTVSLLLLISCKTKLPEEASQKFSSPGLIRLALISNSHAQIKYKNIPAAIEAANLIIDKIIIHNGYDRPTCIIQPTTESSYDIYFYCGRQKMILSSVQQDEIVDAVTSALKKQ